ncbi:MAG: FtsX-like permease family protein [Bacteroidales bacterium]|nr:FtsX-like permease family protein [Bacteroidales bacterium]
MLKNYLTIAIRNILRSKLFSAINILGLAIGMAASILIIEFIAHELSFDKFHENKDRLYRVIVHEENSSGIGYNAHITAAIAVSIVEEFPEAESMVRFSNPGSAYFSYGDKNYFEDDVRYADSSIFDLMSFELIYGDKENCLKEPWSVVLTEKMSNKIFGNENPVGKVIRLNGEGRLTNLFVLASLAFFILLIACFNFMNLSTARAVKRAREVGIRKVNGANRQMISAQFLSESIFISFIALVLALFFVELFQPVFNTLTGRELHLFQQSGAFIILLVMILIILTGFVAGSYPAFFMSRYQVVRVLKGNLVQSNGKPVLRNILVVVQFLISTFLIFSTIIIQSQINYLQNKPLGFNKENVAVIPLTTKNSKENYKVLKRQIKGIPGVTHCGASTGIPGMGLTMNGYLPEGLTDPIMIHVIDVDDDYLSLLEIPVIQGKGFDRESGLDTANVLINEALARQLGWNDPIGKTIKRGIEMKVTGLVQDFHFAPLKESIEPLIITQNPWNGFYHLSVRIEGRNFQTTIDQIKHDWSQLFPNESFEYFTLTSHIEDAYKEISGLRQIFIYFTILAIIVACLGLLGLASYTTGQRCKEVGIRKVFGASNTHITIWLTSDFLKWVLLANIIAFPIAWWVMDQWLQNFAYHTSPGLWAFALTLFITLGLSFLTVIVQANAMARTKPVDILKYE